MAESFSDIMSNYKNMSIEELGGSLLQRQSDQAAAAAKRAKKQDRVQQALALMLTGQAIFKGAYKRRTEELEAAKTWEARDNKAQAQQINVLSRLVPSIPENFHTDKTAEERAELLMQDNVYRNDMKAKMGKYVDTQLAAVFPDMDSFRNTGRYKRVTDESIKAIATHMFQKDDNGIERYKNFETQLAGIFKDKDYDRLELFQKGVGLDEFELTDYEAENYKLLQRQYRDQSGLIGGIKSVFGRLGKKAEREGRVNLFSKIDDKHLANPKLSQVLESLDLKGLMIPIVDRAIANVQAAPKRFSEEAGAEKNAPLQEAIKITFGEMQSLVGQSDPESIDADGLLKIGVDRLGFDYKRRKQDPSILIVEEDFEVLQRFMDDPENAALNKKFFNDVTALALRFREDPSVAKDLYAPFATSPEQLEQFVVSMNDPEFANQFAIAITAKENFDADTTMDFGSWDSSYASKGLSDQTYEPSSAFNALIGTSRMEVVVDAQGNDKFRPTKEYTTADSKIQTVIYDQTVRKILEAPSTKLSDAAKQKTLDNLFNNVPNPRGMGQLDYLQAMAEDREEFNRIMMRSSQGMYTPMPLNTPVADYLKKKESTDPEQFTEELSNSRIESLSRPYTPDQMNENVVSDAIDIAVSISTQPQNIINRRGTMLKAFSNYESDFGTNKNTFRTDPNRATGFTQMIPNESILEVKRVLNPITADGVGESVVKYNQMIIETLGSEYDLNKIGGELKVIDKDNYELINYNPEDMQIPLKHALMASAYLSRIEDPIPVNEDDWGQYYQDNWNTGDAYGNHVAKFNFKNRRYSSAAKQTVKSLLGRD